MLHWTAISLAALLLAYHQITTWVPLFPWNDVGKYTRKQLLLEAGFNGLLMGIGLLCLLSGNSGFSHWYPLIYYPFLFTGECIDWWIPYWSEPFAKARKIDDESHFSRTVKLIPHRDGKRTPDANHTILHFMTVVTILVVYLDRTIALNKRGFG